MKNKNKITARDVARTILDFWSMPTSTHDIELIELYAQQVADEAYNDALQDACIAEPIVRFDTEECQEAASFALTCYRDNIHNLKKEE
jgi:hypothetical protein